MGFVAKAMYRPLTLNFRSVDWSSVRDLFSFSIYRFIWIVANQLIFYSDSLVIAVFLGALRAGVAVAPIAPSMSADPRAEPNESSLPSRPNESSIVSGFSSAAFVTASEPLDASPITSISASPEMKVLIPWRNNV
jgi:O-antigen/teichoic acid export membrane protein